ncbi:hypothetical protein QQX98_000515 [Neonectria punicea]|uniref:NACHT domain-containing protein n=1 Tax=Neonectria punicea TaxID=979145 RepID=A0ABR1HTU5_9HYPO
MATSTYDGFGRTLEKFRRTLSDEQKRAFSSTNLDDVKKAMQDIQDQIGPGKKLRNFIRLKKFLEGMKQMEELVKVFAQVHEVVAFVWGPIKLALMVAATKVEILELLLGVYQEIGDVLHGVERYTRLFQKHSEARQILETYFYDVLQFHTEVLKVFTKPGWKRLFTYAWPTFKTRFQPIIDSLKRHKGLLSDEKHTIVIEEVQELSADFKDKFAELRQAISESDTKHQESIASQKSRIIAKINPLRYESDHDLVSKKRHMSESGASGNWILQDPKFRSWVDDSSPESIFYLHGMPGSGKTTLASRIVDYMNTRRPKPEGLVVFFYFKHNFKKGTRRTVAEMLRTLLAQLLAQDDALLEYMHQQFASNSDSEPFLKGCAKHCFMSQKRAWVILDGLDECDEEYEINKPESQRVLRWFREDLFPACQAQGCQIRLLISGQRDGYVDAVLSKCPDINLDTANGHVSDIREYTKSRASFIREDFSLDSTQEADIIERVVSTSKGMFLYAKVVLDNLISQESPADLDDELKQDHFPQALDAAYLVETGRLHLYEEHARMAIFCTRYLSSSPFDKEQFADTIEKFALTGYYGLLDYASAFWQHHVNSVVTCKAFLDAALQDDVAQSVARLLEGWGTDKPDAQAPHGLDITFIESRMAEWLRAESDFTGPFKHIINIRRLVEDIDHDSLNEDTRKALALNGLARFKCPRTRCFKFATGFRDQLKRDLHLQEHERSFKCSTEGCYARITGFPTQSAHPASPCRRGRHGPLLRTKTQSGVRHLFRSSPR